MQLSMKAFALLALSGWNVAPNNGALGFSLGPSVLSRTGKSSTTTTTTATNPRVSLSSGSSTTTMLFLQTGVEVPLLNLLDEESELAKNTITPLPSSHLPDEVATPFLYGMQVETPLHKLLLEEATTSAETRNDGSPAIYGHVVWKDPNTDSLVGAIGCTAQILVNAPTVDVLNAQIAEELKESTGGTDDGEDSDSDDKTPLPPSETPMSTVLCRGGYRFVVREVLKTIPYPVAIIDEIEDDAEEDDSDMFSSVSSNQEDDDDEDDDEDEERYSSMTNEELIQNSMIGVQKIVKQKVEDAASKTLSPLEESILKDSGVPIEPAEIEQIQAEEMAAVWDVFQGSLVDDIELKDRKYAIAIMAAELADLNNDIRKQLLLTRDPTERLRIVLKELDELVGMATARKLASQITDKVDDASKDLKVGAPQIPPWARNIRKGMKVEYFWNEEYGWCSGEIVEDPVTIVDELLITIRFEDGEIHRLPLTGEDKVRWRI